MLFLTINSMMFHVAFTVSIGCLGVIKLIDGEPVWGATFIICAICSIYISVRLSAEMMQLRGQIADLRKGLQKPEDGRG